MAITKQKKVEITAKIAAGLKGAEGAAFVSARGIGATEMNALRRELRAQGVSYTVAKKTLMKRAFVEQGIKGTLPELPGEVAIAWSADPIAAPKGVFAFAKANKDKMQLVGGIYEGTFMSKEEITELASIPSYKELQGKFVGVLGAVVSQFVRVVDAKAKSMPVEAKVAEVVPTVAKEAVAEVVPEVVVEETPAVADAPVAEEVAPVEVAPEEAA